jgi:hypothetical protein
LSESTFYIHIGTHKTGSTTIQNTLSKHAEDLIREKIHYLGMLQNHARILRAITRYDQNLTSEIANEIENKISVIESPDVQGHSYILSNEKFTGDKIISYKNADIIAKTLFEATKHLRLNVKIIVYIRRQSDFIESTYAQRIFSGESYSFQEFVDIVDIYSFYWDKLIDAYSHYFGSDNVIVLRYGKTFLPHKNSLINNFGKCVSSNFLEKYDETHFANSGFNRHSLELMRICNKHFSRNDRKFFREVLKEVDENKSFKKYNYLSSELREELYRHYFDSNENVNRSYFNGAVNGALFPKPVIDNNPVENNGLDVEDVIVTLMNLILKLNNDWLNSDNHKSSTTSKKVLRKLNSIFRN